MTGLGDSVESISFFETFCNKFGLMLDSTSVSEFSNSVVSGSVPPLSGFPVEKLVWKFLRLDPNFFRR